MKKLITATSILILTAASLLLGGCNKSENGGSPEAANAPKAGASADKNSFKEVTAQLEGGGDLLPVPQTEQLVSGISAKLAAVRNIIDALPNAQGDDREKLHKVFDVLTSVIKDSGIEDVSGFGASSLMHQPGLYHNKVMLHHYSGKGTGFLWNMFGSKPHALTGLEMLPDTTVAAYFGDLDLAMLWGIIQKEVAKANLPEADQALAKLPEMFEGATGMKWNQLLASLGGEYGFAIMLDESHKITLPIPGQPMDIPEPSLMLVVKTKDDTIFNRLEGLMKQSGQEIVSVEKPNLKMRTLPLALPLPIALRPTIASSQGYLLIANSDNVIQQALKIKAGEGKGIKSTPEFQRLAKDVPMEGNHFSFISQRFGQTVLQLQEQAMQHMAGGNAPTADWVNTLVGTNGPGCGFCVSANTEQGWLSIGNNNQHPAKVMLAATVVPVAIASAVALPAIAKAKAAAQKHHSSDSQNQ